MTNKAITKVELSGIKLFKRGKVRDVFDLDDKLMIVATDRISCFDCVLPTPISDKGKILTQLSLFWFDFTKNIIPNHIISANVKDYPPELQKYADILDKRSTLVKKADMIEIECVVRGYLSGSGWKEYKETGSVAGIKLPKGLKESSKLPEPIFTPSIKAKTGHDENIDEKKMKEIIGDELGETLKQKSLELYKAAAKFAESKGIIIADTKFEFGKLGDKIILIDEILTPDSSRFWPKATYKEGGPQKSYDKQFVRDYLLTLDWDKNPPAPPLPDDVVKRSVEKYMEALKQLSGKASI
ncbi:phosphoribosylaminoimidazolesuccinocarboxamide synthase [Candidatus Margulisiibacteriota bacterium]